jgi:hypothetical protein
MTFAILSVATILCWALTLTMSDSLLVNSQNAQSQSHISWRTSQLFILHAEIA